LLLPPSVPRQWDCGALELLDDTAIDRASRRQGCLHLVGRVKNAVTPNRASAQPPAMPPEDTHECWNDPYKVMTE
jgi:hypothetical protein